MRTYETDFLGWTEDTASAIEEGRWSEIDVASLVDEVRSLGRQERSRMQSTLTVVFHHLLKERFQPTKRSRSWTLTIEEHRTRAQELLAESPSLKQVLSNLTCRAYRTARLRAARETGLDLATFPAANPFTDSDIWGS